MRLSAGVLAASAISGCASRGSGTLNLAQDSNDDNVATITLKYSLAYRCTFYSFGNRIIKINPSKVIVSPGRSMLHVDCWATLSSFASYSGGSLIFEAEAGHEYKVYPEDRCLRIEDVETEKVLDSYCN